MSQIDITCAMGQTYSASYFGEQLTKKVTELEDEHKQYQLCKQLGKRPFQCWSFNPFFLKAQCAFFATGYKFRTLVDTVTKK